MIRHITWFLGAVENFRFFDLQVYPFAGPQAAVAQVRGEGLIKPTGRIYRQEYVVFPRAAGGKMVFMREYFDPTRAAKALKTPTSAARFRVDRVQRIHDELRLSRDRVRASSLDQLHRCRRRLLDQRPHFVRHALSLVHAHHQRRASSWYSVSRSLQSCLHRHRRLLQRGSVSSSVPS